MAYKLKVERRAFKQLEKLPRADRMRATKAILALEENPFPAGKKWIVPLLGVVDWPSV